VRETISISATRKSRSTLSSATLRGKLQSKGSPHRIVSTAPTKSRLQQERTEKSGRLPKYESLPGQWLPCKWQHRGCLYTNKRIGDVNRHGETCSAQPPTEGKTNPKARYVCPICPDRSWSRRDRFRNLKHYNLEHSSSAPLP
jgi:hypothetical protein